MTVHIYSGRPNPNWTIGSKEYDEVLLRINGLPPTDTQNLEPLLGYSGIVMISGAETIHAFKELITISDGKKVKAYADKKRIVERHILQSAPKDIQQEIKGILPDEPGMV